jgi:hypothetical protein
VAGTARNYAAAIKRRQAKLVVVGAASVAVALASGCGGSSSNGASPTTGADAGPPTEVHTQVPAPGAFGRQLIAQTGCLACHRLGSSGNRTLATDLTHIGGRLSRRAIMRALRGGPNIMPSYASLGEKRLNEAADYLSGLK